MLSRLIGFFLCLFALLLPWRLRVLFSEFLGWIIQGLYYTYYGIFNYVLTELRKSELEKKDAR